MYCIDCENKIIGDYIMTSDGYTICKECYNKNWFKCKICGEITHKDFESKYKNICIYCDDN